MDISDIKSFLAVIEYRSISLAAKKCFVSQSAMSKRIQKMENQLGARLFIIEGIRFTITEVGKQLVPFARQMLAAHNNMMSALQESSVTVKHDIIVGASVYVSNYILPKVVYHLNHSESTLQAHIKTLSEKEAENYLSHGMVDLIICPERAMSTKLVEKLFLWEGKYHFVVAKNHKLSMQKTPLSLKELADYPAIFTEKGAHIRDKIDDLFEEKAISLNIDFEISTLEAIRSLVEYGLGWSLLPDNLLSDKVTVINLEEDLEIHVKFYLYYLNNKATSKVVDTFYKHFIGSSVLSFLSGNE